MKTLTITRATKFQCLEIAFNNQVHRIDDTEILLHDIEHVLAGVGFSTQDEKDLEMFAAKQLSQEAWHEVYQKLDNGYLGIIEDNDAQAYYEFLTNIALVPEYYQATYPNSNIDSWLCLFAPDRFVMPQGAISVVVQVVDMRIVEVVVL
jgi:hypothetical protein